jgi:hypothetical protein
MAPKMTEAHKKALARGRRQAKVVRDYLEAISKNRRPGRPVTKESLEKQIERIRGQIEAEENPAAKVELIQKRLDAEGRLGELETEPDVDGLAKGFAKVAKEYSERKEISYHAWREAGVPASVLREAGVPRTRRAS